MILSRAVGRIQQILGFRPDLQNEAKQAIAETIEDLENGQVGFLPWFLEASATEVLSSEDEGFDLPTGFLRENDETEYAKSLFLDGGNIPTQKTDFIPTGTYRGRVWFYWLTPTRVMFDRKMGEPRTVDFLHFARSEVPTQDSDEGPWLRNASLLVIGLAGNKLAGLRDTRALQVFSGMAQGGQRTLLQQHTARRQAGQQMAFGGVDQPYLSLERNDQDRRYE